MRQRLGMINNGQSSSLYQQQIRTLLANKQGKEPLYM